MTTGAPFLENKVADKGVYAEKTFSQVTDETIGNIPMDYVHWNNTTHTYDTEDEQSYFPTYYSKAIITSGARGSGTHSLGLFHDVKAEDDCQDAAALMHHFFANGLASTNRADTAAISYFHAFNGAGTGYSSIIEGTQIVYATGFLGWGQNEATSLIGMQCSWAVDNAYSGSIATSIFLNVINHNDWTGYTDYSADICISFAGRWDNIFKNVYGTIPLVVSTCGLDLYSNITWGDGVPAIMLNKTTYIGLHNSNPGCYYYIRAEAVGATTRVAIVSGGYYSITCDSFGDVNMAYDVYVGGSLTVAASANITGTVTVTGNISATGSILSAGAKPFRITHPLDESKWLYHVATESPRADLLYRGKIQLVSGRAEVELDKEFDMTKGTFEKLVRDTQGFFQNLTGEYHVSGEVRDGVLYLVSDERSNDTVGWLVIGERQDKEIKESALSDLTGRIIPEWVKDMTEGRKKTVEEKSRRNDSAVINVPVGKSVNKLPPRLKNQPVGKGRGKGKKSTTKEKTK